jgi:hypothetical protein
MKNTRTTKQRKPSAGSRIVASLREAVDWVEVRLPAGHLAELGAGPNAT